MKKNSCSRVVLGVLLSALLHASSGFAEGFTGQIFEKDSKRQKLLYVVKQEEKQAPSGVTETRRVFASPDGTPAVTEDVTFQQGKLQKYVVRQQQLNETGEIEVRDGKVLFSYTKDGKTGKDEEKLAENFVIGPTVVPYLQKHWATILKGDDVEIRFGVPERKETVGFKFFKIEEKKLGDQDVVVVKMKPTSFVIAALVDPLIFTFSKDGSHLISLLGRTSPKAKVDGKWKDLDADIVYQY